MKQPQIEANPAWSSGELVKEPAPREAVPSKKPRASSTLLRPYLLRTEGSAPQGTNIVLPAGATSLSVSHEVLPAGSASLRATREVLPAGAHSLVADHKVLPSGNLAAEGSAAREAANKLCSPEI